jgi:hypothetical protein
MAFGSKSPFLPSFEFSLPSMVRTYQSFAELGITRRAHQGRRAGSGLEHPRIKLSGQSHADALDPKRVLPTVAIVRKVDQPVDAGIFNYRAQRCLARIL